MCCVWSPVLPQAVAAIAKNDVVLSLSVATCLPTATGSLDVSIIGKVDVKLAQ